MLMGLTDRGEPNPLRRLRDTMAALSDLYRDRAGRRTRARVS